jgi:hypothetical protein
LAERVQYKEIPMFQSLIKSDLTVSLWISIQSGE